MCTRRERGLACPPREWNNWEKKTEEEQKNNSTKCHLTHDCREIGCLHTKKKKSSKKNVYLVKINKNYLSPDCHVVKLCRCQDVNMKTWRDSCTPYEVNKNVSYCRERHLHSKIKETRKMCINMIVKCHLTDAKKPKMSVRSRYQDQII